MTFEQWCADQGYNFEELKAPEKAKQRKHLEAAWKADTAPPPVVVPVTETPKAETVDDKLAAYEAESQRIVAITDMTDAVAAENTRNPAKIKQLRELRETAIADKAMDVKSYQLALHRVDRMIGPMVFTPRSQPVTGDVLEAAMCVAGGLENLEKHFTPETLDGAHKQFRGGLGLHAMISHCARRNGWAGHDVKTNWFQAVKYGFRDQSEEAYGAVTGPSTYSLPNLFSSVANKFLRGGFESVGSDWRMIAEITRFTDFKTKTELGLTGSLLYNKLPPSGEIKHGTIGEIAYTNKADTYAVMLGLDRQSLINDDLGALTAVSRRMGRGYGLTLNNLVWTEFLDNSAFFAAGNNNVITGGTSVLSGATGLEALRLATEKFMLQTDPDGLPLGSAPRILLVPSSLDISAKNLMNSTQVVGSTTANSLMPDGNAFAGAYKVVSSPYLQNSAYTGYSATAWYLLADPNDIPVIEVGFLNGVDSPTVETENAEFNMLGIALRGYFDAGVALKEYRGGVRAAGA